jgi:uncharacterized protein (DUF362 family)
MAAGHKPCQYERTHEGELTDPRQFLCESTVALEPCACEGHQRDAEVLPALQRLGLRLGWGDANRGLFANVVPAGARVVVKPNFVLHQNNGPGSFESVITAPALVRSVTTELLRTDAATVSVGDSPVQSCDFDQLLEHTGLGRWAADLQHQERRFTGIRDFRRTVVTFADGVRVSRQEEAVDLEHYSLFDLGKDSLLEPVTTAEPRFRITSYDPAFLARTHAPGRHQYLIAKDVLTADVVVNLPKLKMHKKAGVTNALKNLVGINGNKEYLPHHRIGGPADAGDCYPEKSRLKETLEKLYDFKNASRSTTRERVTAAVLRPLHKMLAIAEDETGVEGAWSGNDTVWRMSLDLNRILIYGRADGTMADSPQRTILHICDAIVAGQGNGPLAPLPFELGYLMAGRNPAAIDLVGADMLGLEAKRIPLVRGAFESFRWPIAAFAPGEVSVLCGDRTLGVPGLAGALQLPVPSRVPAGWKSAAKEPAQV